MEEKTKDYCDGVKKFIDPPYYQQTSKNREACFREPHFHVRKWSFFFFEEMLTALESLKSPGPDLKKLTTGNRLPTRHQLKDNNLIALFLSLYITLTPRPRCTTLILADPLLQFRIQKVFWGAETTGLQSSCEDAWLGTCISSVFWPSCNPNTRQILFYRSWQYQGERLWPSCIPIH